MRAILGRGRGGPWLFFCRSRELFVSKRVWWFLFEGDELGDFGQYFALEFSCSAYDYWDGVDICFHCVMVLKGLFKRLVDIVNVVYDFLYVSVSGFFAFDELALSSSLVSRVFDEFVVGP